MKTRRRERGPSPTLEESLLVYSPFWGVRQIVGEPGSGDFSYGTPTWDGEKVSYLVTSTLVPLSLESAILLSGGRS